MANTEKKRDDMVTALAKTIADAIDKVGQDSLNADKAILHLIEMCMGKVTELNERVTYLEKVTKGYDVTRH